MIGTSRKFEYIDPRTIDGTPFEVAAAAADQTGQVLAVACTAINDTFVIARVAEMERECQEGHDPDGEAFHDSPVGQRLLKLEDTLHAVRRSLKGIAIAASHDPRHPIKEQTA